MESVADIARRMPIPMPQKPALDPSIIQSVLLDGDLSRLTDSERLSYYQRVCESIGLNPLTQPFAYIKLNGKLILYALKAATEQLRMIHGVSITEVTSQNIGDVFVVTAKAQNRDGRTDASTGAVAIGNLKGESLANGLMKAETKAKRRVTLSICGLGMLDETEVETIKHEPPALVIETMNHAPVPPEGYVFIKRIEPVKHTAGGREFTDVVFSNGDVVFAGGKQLLSLLEQIAQEEWPLKYTTKKTGKGFTQIDQVERWKAPEDKPAEIQAPLPVSEIPF